MNKTISLMFIATVLLCTLPANAGPKCAVCQHADAITAELSKSPEKGLLNAIQLFEKVNLSKNAAVRSSEIASLLALAALTLPKNDEGQIDECLYDLYVDHAREIDAAIAKMAAKDRDIIHKSLNNMKRLDIEGNG